MSARPFRIRSPRRLFLFLRFSDFQTKDGACIHGRDYGFRFGRRKRDDFVSLAVGSAIICTRLSAVKSTRLSWRVNDNARRLGVRGDACPSSETAGATVYRVRRKRVDSDVRLTRGRFPVPGRKSLAIRIVIVSESHETVRFRVYPHRERV